MGELIGAKLSAFEEGYVPTPEEVKVSMVEQRAFNTLLYEVSIDKIEDPDKAAWAEADVVICVDKNDIVIGYQVVRVSIENEPTVWFGTPLDRDSDDNSDYFNWIREIAAWAHSVPGMVHWVWFHIHPEGMSQPSRSDENKVALLNAADLLQIGHLGGPRLFGSFVVVQRNGIVAIQSDDVNGIGPKEDALTSRVYAESYRRVLGDDHPLSVAMDAVATSIEDFAEKFDGNPLAMLMYGMSELMPLQAKLNEARGSLAFSSEEFGRLMREDFEANGPIDASAPRTQRPTNRLEVVDLTSDLPGLAPGILADLASFDFDGLDNLSS